MPASLTGLSTYAGGPNITQSNALPNTPFNAGSAAAGVGTGSLGEFGGYIPTPLPQFNNYTDYLNSMPGAQQMDYFASDPLNYGGIGMSDRWGFTQDILRSPYQMQAMQGTEDAARMALGNIYDDQGNVTGNTGTGFIQKDWLPQADQLYNMAGDASQKAQSAWQTGQDVWQTAQDPQNALYARTLQQVQEQSRAADAARGLVTTPYSAGVENQATTNFNIDWQNAMLDRQVKGEQAAMAGAQGYGGLQALGMSEREAAQQLQQQAADATTLYNRAPMDTWNAIMASQIGAIDQYQDYGMKAMMPGQMTFKNWQDVQNQFLTANQQAFNQNQTSGFEDPFAEMQLQSQIEMQREQMNMQEQMQEKQMKQQQQQQMMGMGMQGLGMLGSMGGKGCWIAEAVYGVDDPRTHLVRAWLNGPFLQTVTGRIVMSVYLTIGQQVAALVRSSSWLRAAFKPLFDCALRAALKG